MIALSGTFKARRSCDQTKSMIALSGTFKVRQSCDQTKRVFFWRAAATQTCARYQRPLLPEESAIRGAGIRPWLPENALILINQARLVPEMRNVNCYVTRPPLFDRPNASPGCVPSDRERCPTATTAPGKNATNPCLAAGMDAVFDSFSLEPDQRTRPCPRRRTNTKSRWSLDSMQCHTMSPKLITKYNRTTGTSTVGTRLRYKTRIRSHEHHRTEGSLWVGPTADRQEVDEQERYRTMITNEGSDGLAGILRTAIVELVRRDGPDLSARQLGVFLTCYLETDAQTVRGLAAKLSVSKPAITRALDRLSEFDLVRRKTDPLDRRSVLVQRTATGMAFLRELRTILRDAASTLKITAEPAQARPRSGSEAARATH
jgi:DNA-binding MarR family transcriptional regulator